MKFLSRILDWLFGLNAPKVSPYVEISGVLFEEIGWDCPMCGYPGRQCIFYDKCDHHP